MVITLSEIKKKIAKNPRKLKKKLKKEVKLLSLNKQSARIVPACHYKYIY